jgi:hypothetical protein
VARTHRPSASPGSFRAGDLHALVGPACDRDPGVRLRIRRRGVRRRAWQRGHHRSNRALLQPGRDGARARDPPLRQRRPRPAPGPLEAPAGRLGDAGSAGRRWSRHRRGPIFQPPGRSGAGRDQLAGTAGGGRGLLRPLRGAHPVGFEPPLRRQSDVSAGRRRRPALARHRRLLAVAVFHPGRRAAPGAGVAGGDRQPDSILGVPAAGQELFDGAGRPLERRADHVGRGRLSGQPGPGRDDRSGPRAPVGGRVLSNAARLRGRQAEWNAARGRPRRGR